jgi:hypothetical protein
MHSVQAKPQALDRSPAPHVQAAMTGKTSGTKPVPQLGKSHGQAMPAVGAQAKPAPARPVAAHVQAAVAQAKRAASPPVATQLRMAPARPQPACPPVIQRAVKVGQKTYNDANALLAEFLERTTISYFGQQSIYAGDAQFISQQLAQWIVEDQKFDDWSDLIDEMDSVVGAGLKAMPMAAADLDAVLSASHQKYAIQGSYAARIHGAPVDAGDIDVLVKDLRSSLAALLASKKFKDKGGSFAVKKLQHWRGAAIDLVMADEFGMPIQNIVTIDNVAVMNLYEVLLSLLLRPEKRKKDQDAFIWLVLNKGNTLSSQEQQKIAKQAQAPSWEALLKLIQSKTQVDEKKVDK